MGGRAFYKLLHMVQRLLPLEGQLVRAPPKRHNIILANKFICPFPSMLSQSYQQVTKLDYLYFVRFFHNMFKTVLAKKQTRIKRFTWEWKIYKLLIRAESRTVRNKCTRCNKSYMNGLK